MINSIYSNTVKPTNYIKNDNSNEEEIKILRQQENAIRKQIDSIKNSNQDPKTKKELIEPLESQIQSIEAQIQQTQVDQISNKNDTTNTSISENKSEDNIKFSKDAMFLGLSNTYKQVKEATATKKNLEGKANELNSDAEFDEMMENYTMAAAEKSEASECTGKANGLNYKIGKLNCDMDKSIKNEINKENMKYNVPDASDKSFKENSKGSLEKDSKGDLKSNSQNNKIQSINVLA